MSRQYEKLAADIVKAVGGPESITAARHCQTRLRFNLRDYGKADKASLQNMDGVAQVVESGGMLHMVVGLHVKDVFEEAEKLLPKLDAAEAPAEKRKFGGTFAFLPTLLACTTAKKMRCNVILAMGTLSLSVLGPLGSYGGNGLAVVFNWLSTNVSRASAFLIGGGLTHTHRFATGSSGLPAVLLYISDNSMTYFYNIIIALLISAAATAVVAFLLSLKFEKTESAAETTPRPRLRPPRTPFPLRRRARWFP